MSQPTKPPRRQLALNLGPEIAAPARVPASPVLLQALADLLLEALDCEGMAMSGREDSNEGEDYA